MMLRHIDIDKRVRALDLEDQILFAGHTVHFKIMIVPWFIRIFKPIIKWKLKLDDLRTWIVMFMIMNARSPGMMDDFVVQFLDHLHNGKDVTGEAIVGGYNNKELNTIEQILDFIDATKNIV